MFKIAIFGRPNVGKSSLFNALLGKKKAIVSNVSGITVDRNYELIKLNDIFFSLIDTAGINKETINVNSDNYSKQTLLALEESDLIFFVTDFSIGLIPLDFELAKFLRKFNKTVFHLVNKYDVKNKSFDFDDINKIGFKNTIFISSEHKLGFNEIYNNITDSNKFNSTFRDVYNNSHKDNLRISIVGKPNSGKSTLINTIIGRERLVTGDKPGLTKDSIDISFYYKNFKLIFTDTAGLRKKPRIYEYVEKQSSVKTMNAIRNSDITILITDANESFNKQDLIIANKALDYGKPMILALNKWDIIQHKSRVIRDFKDRMKYSLSQIQGLKILPISGLTKFGIKNLIDELIIIHNTAKKRISTSDLNQWFRIITDNNPPPLVNGKKNTLKYISQVDNCPPFFVINCSYPNKLPKSYIRYIQNNLVQNFKFSGIPIKFKIKKSSNPFTDQKS